MIDAFAIGKSGVAGTSPTKSSFSLRKPKVQARPE